MTKKMIFRQVGTPVIRTYDFRPGSEYLTVMNTVTVYVEGKIDNLIDTLSDLKKKYPGYTDLKLCPVRDCGCRHDCGCSPTFYLHGTCEETDLEYNFRMDKEHAEMVIRENKERAEFIKLKEKYDK